KNGVCRPPSSFDSTYTSPLNVLYGLIVPGFAITCPRSTSFFSMPRNSSPTLSPARPSSSSFLNISTPVTTVLRVSRNPTISISSPTFQLHQIQQLRIVHHVDLVHGHHNVRHAYLPRQQDVLPCLRHRPIGGRHHHDRAIHLRRARDHVLDVVGVARTIHMRVMPLGGL